MEADEKIKTSGLKLSELEPCSFCEGSIAPLFYVLDIKFGLFGRGTNQVLAMSNFFGGGAGALQIAEAMSPGANEAVLVAEDVKQLGIRLFICQKCFLEEEVGLARAVERTRYMREAAARRKGSPE